MPGWRRECSPGSYLGGVINSIIDIVIDLEVAWPARQHMDVHVRHRLPRMSAILQPISAECKLCACQDALGLSRCCSNIPGTE